MPSEEDIETCFKALKSSKAEGEDGIPKEFYQYSPSVKQDLFELIKGHLENRKNAG